MTRWKDGDITMHRGFRIIYFKIGTTINHDDKEVDIIGSRYECPHCDSKAIYSSRNNINGHEHTCERTSTVTIRCNKCGKKTKHRLGNTGEMICCECGCYRGKRTEPANRG